MQIDFSRPQTYSIKPEKSHIKTYAAIGSAVGMSAMLALVAKRQGFSLNPKTILKTPLKDWAIFGITEKNRPDKKILDIKEREILELAGGSILGGLTSGAIFDRENMKAKGREALTQSVGNVVIPVTIVSLASKLYKKYEQQIKNAMPQIKGSNNIVKFINKFIKICPAVAITSVALGCGILLGSKVTNLINEKLFGQKKTREIKTTDFAPHVDDVCLAITLLGGKDSPIANTITRTVPFFLSIPGYQVGKAKEN